MTLPYGETVLLSYGPANNPTIVTADDPIPVEVSSGGLPGTATAPAQTSVGTTAAQILAANSSRKRLVVQNTGTTIVKIVFGAGTPTQTAYHLALAACVAADDGKGGTYLDDWTGAVQAISSAASGTVVITEMT